MNYQIPVCYFPGTVLLIDDNRKYLSRLVLELETSQFSPKLYDNPQQALQFVQNYHFDPFVSRCLHQEEETAIDHRNIDVDIRSIVKEAENSQRFQQITVVVTDYAMPQLNGLDLCRQLKAYPFKKLLLTGEADENKAVSAFNEGIIDKFIRKDDTHFGQTFNQAIEQLQKKYFLELSQLVLESLMKGPKSLTVKWLDDPVFIEFFEELRKKKNIVEYYLTDAEGSFLFLDNKAKPSWFVIKSQQELESLFKHAEIEEAPAEVVNALKTRKSLPYFYTEEDLQAPPSEWQKYMHAAKELKGRNDTYYYAYIDNPKAYDFDSAKVLSYYDYLQQR
jgi:CheY-like chemotaxis protein